MLPTVVRGARTHNLKGIDVTFCPGEVVAITGRSGSGKSSLAMDTLYAEGQRRFVESFSPYARQFLERLPRPPVLSLDPVSASIAVDRRAPIRTSRSTLATMTDIEPFLAILFASVGIPVCATCGVDGVVTTGARVAERVLGISTSASAVVTFPRAVRDGEHVLAAHEDLLSEGYHRVWHDGSVKDLHDVRPSAFQGVMHVVQDRVKLESGSGERLAESIEAAWGKGGGTAHVRLPAQELVFTRGLSCPSCGERLAPPHRGLFSYSSPLGACGTCKGFGRVIAVDWDKVIPDPRKGLKDGAIRPWTGKSTSWERRVLADFARRENVRVDTPWGELSEAERDRVLRGDGKWGKGRYPGLILWFQWLESRAYKMHVRVLLSRYRAYTTCTACGGSRFAKGAERCRVAGLSVSGWHALTVSEAKERLSALPLRDAEACRVKSELLSRLGYLDRVGLSYLTLDRQSRTLSGGEAQRASLTTALGAALTGTLFVLDEPTVGLHPSDVPKLADAIFELAESDNTLLVIEHDEALVRRAGRVIELGPEGGPRGGSIVFDGAPSALFATPGLPTAQGAKLGRRIGAARASSRFLSLRGANLHNLRRMDVDFPLGVLTAVTGPSGSGKTTLLRDILVPALSRALGRYDTERPGEYTSLSGYEGLLRVVVVDQSPLGRTARGNAATYTKAWDRIRARLAREEEALRRGFSPSHFSFNVALGRCEACKGEGYETVEMQFLADVSLLCPSCQGKRFLPEVLAVRTKDKNVADILEMTVEETLAHLDPEARDRELRRTLSPLLDVGLGYLPMGQPLSTLSGGEAQRLKLARALTENPEGALFIVDEPSAGLHALDTHHVVSALRRLVDSGATVIAVEHDMRVVSSADYLIDLGPGGGPQGGTLVFAGPLDHALHSKGKTSAALSSYLEGNPAHAPTRNPVRRSEKGIIVEEAREHNLKGISCTLPRNALSIVTGRSGSGKSTLAFDVVFAEGQRRFLETLSPYARQFLPTMPRPHVERVLGIPPSIALPQRRTRAGANSTVATVTEVAHYLRLLYAKVGEVFCPTCDVPVLPLTAQEAYARVAAKKGKGELWIPAVRGRKGLHHEVFAAALRAGIAFAEVDGKLLPTEPPPKLKKTNEHTVNLLLFSGRWSELSEEHFLTGLRLGDGTVSFTSKRGGERHLLSTTRACPRCGDGIPEMDPRWFSFNTKQGQCPTCEGAGTFDEGTILCPECRGGRLAPLPRGVRLFGKTYAEFSALSVERAYAQASQFRFEKNAAIISEAPHAELLRRLAFLSEVGLSYLTLDRRAHTLSGGEMQRLRLSAQLGSGLTGALYVLDEPTIGLHPKDTGRLIQNLKKLVDTGSTVLVVEHDASMIRAADYLIDMGPMGGKHGGHIVSMGRAHEVLADPRSPTAQALSPTSAALRPKRPMADAWISLVGARAHNLKNVSFRIPTGRMTVVAGVSGSGKSTLVRQVFLPALRKSLGLVHDAPGPYDKLVAHRSLRRAVAVDQSPMGRTPRSVPATFLGIWDDIRKLFATLPEAKVRGFGAAQFSFNSGKGGRCPTCEGQGILISEMSFLPEVISPCEACDMNRFDETTLLIRYLGMNIGEVLKLTADEAADLFRNHPRIVRPLQTMMDLGVGYLALGQPSNTLSGGEAQRLKLAAELTAGSQHEPTLYVLDEPTTGLHVSDARQLVAVLDKLVARGDTLVVIEHHPDVIASADWVIELGPEGGERGGHIVFEGEPKKLARARTATGTVLRELRLA